MARDEDLRNKLITYIENAYTMEKQIAETLEKQVKDAQSVPEIQARIQQHLDATRQHEARMEDRLKAYNKSPSGLKAAVGNVMGNVMGAMSGTRSDSLAMSARDDYAVEHFEIGTYGMLITVAQAAGDQDTVLACEANLRDEFAMAQWLEQHLVQAVAISLHQESNITLSQVEQQNAEATLRSLMQSWRQTVPPGEQPPVAQPGLL